FHCSLDSRPLHSFPTRRSSDLGLPGGRHGVVYDSGDYPKLLELAVEKIGPKPEAGGRMIGLGIACCVESTAFGRGEPASLQVDRDRKSTRLNSSHRTISYAVFC